MLASTVQLTQLVDNRADRRSTRSTGRVGRFIRDRYSSECI